MPGNVISRPLNHQPIPGLEQRVTRKVLEESCDLQNNLPDETVLPIVHQERFDGLHCSDAAVPRIEEHLDHLRQIIWRANAQDLFGVIALHKHDLLRPECSLVGRVKESNHHLYYWTEELVNETINLEEICGYKFAFTKEQGLQPFEFRQGQMPDLSHVDMSLFPEFVDYLIEHDLTSRLGLELAIPELSRTNMTEFTLDHGTLLVQSTLLSHKCAMKATTSWKWQQDRTGIYSTVIDCVLNRDGKHEQWVSKDKRASNLDDILHHFERAVPC